MTITPPSHLLIFGAGGFGREAVWLARTIHGNIPMTFVVDRPEYLRGAVDGLQTVLLDDVPDRPGQRFVVAIGEPAARRVAVDRCEARGLVATQLVHPDINLTGANIIGDGTILCAGVVITTGIRIGKHVQINLNSTVGHDAVVGDFSTVAPGVNISGNVQIGDQVSVGTGASVINGQSGHPLIIGDRAVVAAGACVTKPVEPDSLVAGVPAIRKR